jgi:hypothetical protein
MYPHEADMLLIPTILLYNNIATFRGVIGRLSVTLNLQPAPSIKWEFESVDPLREDVLSWGLRAEEPIIGPFVEIEEPYLAARDDVHVLPGLHKLHGIAITARIGVAHVETASYSFYLPNLRLLRNIHLGDEMWFEEQTVVRASSEEHLLLPGAQPNRIIVRAELDSNWGISLDIGQRAQEWLSDPMQTGTQLTTIGSLYSLSGRDHVEKPQIANISIGEAKRKLEHLGYLLSFANGGYVNALYLRGYTSEHDRRQYCAKAISYEITPIELIGDTWFTDESNLKAYLACYHALEKMLATDYWKDLFPLLLIWYFQAIQPQNIQVATKPWQVSANAVGAALERISMIILAEEFGQSYPRQPKAADKIKALLKTTGLLNKTWHHREATVEDFVRVRNDATHAEQKSNLPTDERYRMVQIGIMWLEEVFLWRLGYSGKYGSRGNELRTSVDHRYDLSKRKPEWG